MRELYCSFDSNCLAIQCCISLDVNIIKRNFKAYAAFDVDEMSLSIGFESWKKVWVLESDYLSMY